MTKPNDSSVTEASLIGISLKSSHFRNIWALNNFFLTGKTAGTLFDNVNPNEKTSSNNTSLEDRISEAILDALKDADMNLQSISKQKLSIFIKIKEDISNTLFALSKNKQGFIESIQNRMPAKINVEEVNLLTCGLHEALKNVFTIIDAAENNICIFVNLFSESKFDLPKSITTKNISVLPPAIIGYVFSNHLYATNSYLEISLNRFFNVLNINSEKSDHEPEELYFARAVLSICDQVMLKWSENTENEIRSRRLQPLFPDPYSDLFELSLKSQKSGESIQVSKSYSKRHWSNSLLDRFNNLSGFLLPFKFSDLKDAKEEISLITAELKKGDDLEKIEFDQISKYSKKNENQYSLVILGSTVDEIQIELDRTQENLSGYLDSGKEWQTPVGSYFTPFPLGAQAKIAFVYPGAFGTYVGMGSEIFYLFPDLLHSIRELTNDSETALNAEIIFPSMNSAKELENCQKNLDNSPTMMISSGTCFSFLFTTILRDIFKVNPNAVLGYSLGEISMMFATGIWTQADAIRTSLEASPLFHERVSGRQNAIREFWKIPANSEVSSIWSNYILMAPYEKVSEKINSEDHVYVTHINTPRQVVIGGDDKTCRRIADELGCMRLKAPYEHAIHCDPVLSEYEAFRKLHDWPMEYDPQIPVYSAADYAPLALESGKIARSFATMLTHQIDFPRLVKRVHADGAQVFIELGAGSNCTKWIDSILDGIPHAAMSINQNNASDHMIILRLLARLISHRIPVDLNPFFKS